MSGATEQLPAKGTREHRMYWAPVLLGPDWGEKLGVPEKDWCTLRKGEPYSHKLYAPDGSLQTYKILCEYFHTPYTLVGYWDKDGNLADVLCLSNGMPLDEAAAKRQTESVQRIQNERALVRQRLVFFGVGAVLAAALAVIGYASFQLFINNRNPTKQSRQRGNTPPPLRQTQGVSFLIDPSITQLQLMEQKIIISPERRSITIGEHHYRTFDMTKPVRISRSGPNIEIVIHTAQEIATILVGPNGRIVSSGRDFQGPREHRDSGPR